MEAALPSILGLTNQLARVLTNALGIVTHTDELLVSAKPVVNNLAQLSANLTNRQGSLGEWLLPTNLNARLDSTLASADSAVNAAETNLNQISAQVTASLINVANLTSNLNAQVQANGLILSQVSDLIMSTDEMVQGLKRHWLLRGAFGAETNQPLRSVVKPRIGSPQ